jgi:methyltransferase-like protein
VAFVSYNTYPGWHLRGMVREMMLYHVSTFDDPQSRIDQSQAFLDFLVRFVPAAEGPYATFLANEMERLRNRPRTNLFHEHLESTNLPLYFHEFMERAAATGLQYLGDDNLPSSWSTRVPPDAARLLAGLGSDFVRREQYLDFLQGSAFRRTLLCRAGAKLNAAPDPDVLRRGYLSACLTPATPMADLHHSEIVEFKTPEGPSVDLGDPMMKAAAIALGESWPQACSFDDVLRLAARKLSTNGDAEAHVSPEARTALLQGLLRCVAAGLVELRLTPDQFIARVSETPRTTRFARRRAELGLPVTNAVHASVALNEIHRHVLRRLDGRHDLTALVAALEDDVRQGTLTMAIDGVPLEDELRRRDALIQVVHDGLTQFARQALLVE